MKRLLLLMLSVSVLAIGCATTAPSTTKSVSMTEGGNVEKVHIEKDDGEKVKVYDYQAVFKDKDMIATGIFKHDNEGIAANMSLNMAINNLAKSAGEVIQKEDTTLYNDKVSMLIETKASSIVKGFRILAQTYDTETKIAETTIKVEGEQIASYIEKELEKSK